MSTFGESRKKCANCGFVHEYEEMFSTFAFGSDDLDFRSPPPARYFMDMWLQECPRCGYIAPDISERPKGPTGYLKSERFKNCNGISFKSKLLARFYKRYMICTLENDIEGCKRRMLTNELF